MTRDQLISDVSNVAEEFSASDVLYALKVWLQSKINETPESEDELGRRLAAVRDAVARAEQVATWNAQ